MRTGMHACANTCMLHLCCLLSPTLSRTRTHTLMRTYAPDCAYSPIHTCEHMNACTHCTNLHTPSSSQGEWQQISLPFLVTGLHRTCSLCPTWGMVCLYTGIRRSQRASGGRRGCRNSRSHHLHAGTGECWTAGFVVSACRSSDVLARPCGEVRRALAKRHSAYTPGGLECQQP